MKANFLSLGLVVSLAACATSPDPNRSAAAPNSRPYVSSQTEGPDLGAIDGFGVPQGRCGMVLYTQSGVSPIPIFRSTDDGAAQMEIEGQMTTLVLVGRGGETRMNVPSAQYFRGTQPQTGEQVGVEVQTRWGKTFPSGAYVDDGTITVTAADGWSRVVPVAGIAGCRG